MASPTTLDDTPSALPSADPGAAHPHGRLPDLLLVAVTMVWGTTFLVIHTGLQSGGPFTFMALRFVTAVAVLALLAARVLKGVTAHELRAGVAIGAVLWLSFALQTIGLQHIESSKSAFLTALYVPAVPLIQLLVLGIRPRAAAWVGIALAFGGLMLLAGPKGLTLSLGYGEAITVIGAVVTAIEILMIGHFARGCEPRRLAVIQMSTAAVLSLLGIAIAHEPAPTWSVGFIACAAGLGLASAFIQISINWAQKFVSPARATVIYTLEPVWAGLIGAVAGERFGAWGYVGAALILAGVFVSELRWERRADHPA